MGLAQALRFNTYSCDVSESTVNQAREMYPKAHIYHAESREFLQEVLPTIGGQVTLFFLDAHFPEFTEYDAPVDVPRWPVYEELQLIKQLKVGYERDVIWCDDFFVVCDPENPRYREAEMFASPIAQRDRPFRDYVALFADTHDYIVYPEFEGILAFYPKVRA